MALWELRGDAGVKIIVAAELISTTTIYAFQRKKGFSYLVSDSLLDDGLLVVFSFFGGDMRLVDDSIVKE